ncbi:MAG: hypothetical protein KAT68_06095 [Bacteroidales bacterium]|nr:hypothetical protein [Bacteroidales bacterium]
MKKLIVILICCSTALFVQAQKKAVTETGDEVILYDDGTWKYVNDTDIENNEIPTNSKKFEKSDNSTFLLKSTKLDVGVWLDTKKWSFKKAGDNPEAEYELKLKIGDLYGMIISEKIEIPLKSLKGIALENGKTAAPDLHIVKEEYRNVNGLTILLLQMNGTMQGIKFSYYGYYFSNSNGTVQFITYTSQNLLDEYKNDCEELLNGLVEIK